MGELSLAVRSLLKSKLFTIVAIAMLTIGIGASTAIFAIFSGVALRPLPFPRQDRLVDVEEWSAAALGSGSAVGLSAPTLEDVRGRSTTMQSLASYLELPANLGGSDTPERVSAGLVSGNFFGVLGVQPAVGRLIDPTDDRADSPPVAVLSQRLFARRFASDSSIIGQDIRVNGAPTRVIGVARSDAVLPELAEIWFPMARSYRTSDRSARELGVIGRLRDEATAAGAGAELRTIAASIAAAHPENTNWTLRVRPLREALAGEEESTVAVMLGAVLILLLIVCANLAGLMIARGAARQKDIAVRLALGGRRSTIVWHLLAESLCLAVVGGILGTLAASWSIDLLLAGLGTQIPSWLDARLDARVLAFTVGVTLVSALAFGLIPALQSSRPDVQADIKAGGLWQIGDRKHRLRGSLVAVQMALSLVLLAAAGVLAVNVERVSRRELGPNDENVVQGSVEFLGPRTQGQIAAEVQSLVSRLSTVPGVRSAAAYGTGFIAGFGAQDQSIRADGIAQVPAGVSPRFYFAITPAYFETRRMPVVRGRGFTDADRMGAPLVAIINESLGKRLWPTSDPVGHRIKLGGADSLPWRTIVGTVSDIGNPAVGRIANYAYVPFAQDPHTGATLLIGARTKPDALINAIREAARESSPDLPISNLMTVEAAQARNYWPYRAYALLMTAVGAVALLLAAIGLYGIVAFAAQRRAREVGLRIALGAGRRDVVHLITRQGVWFVVGGLVIGIAGALLIVPVMQSAMWGWANKPFNPYVFAAAAGVLMLVSLIASYLPARRATQIDPMEALRQE